MVSVRDLLRLLRPLERRVGSMFSRGTWRLADDSGGRQTGQVTYLAGEVRNDQEHVQPFGFSAVPPDEGEAFAAFPNGNRELAIVLHVEDRRYRPRGLEVGETSVYNAHGVTIKLLKDGSVLISASGGVRVQGDLVVTGDVVAGGDVADSKGSLAELRQAYDEHVHQENGTGGGVTDPPLPQV